MKLSRRAALGLIGSAAAAGCAPIRERGSGAPVRFEHGVASGDPAQDGAVIWTRATPAGETGDVPLRWIVSAGPGGRALRSGAVDARAARDCTAKVDVRGLRPGNEYW